jgi:U3 small nucleolar RNA-associated protein 7
MVDHIGFGILEMGGEYFDLLPSGPDGDDRHLAIVGKKGHVATFDALTGNIHSELQLKETCRDITCVFTLPLFPFSSVSRFLQDTSFHAIAQKKSVFIYDKSGVEIHRLSSLLEPTRLTFLPYHYVLVCASLTGYLNYLDTTTGAIISKHNSHLGACEVMDHNPQNAVVGMGHRNGQLTFWTPNVNEPVVRLMAHLGPVSGFAHWGEDGLGGRTLATAGVDSELSFNLSMLDKE